jgi:hypothetical protein
LLTPLAVCPSAVSLTTTLCVAPRQISPSNFVRRQLLPSQNWLPVNATTLASTGVCQFRYKEGNFSVTLKLRPYNNAGHLDLNPHTTFTVNSSSIDLAIADFSFGVQEPSASKAPNYRLALELFFYKRDDQVGDRLSEAGVVGA